MLSYPRFIRRRPKEGGYAISIRKKIYLLFTVLGILILAAPAIWARRPVPRKENGIEQLHFAVGDRLQGYEVYDSYGEGLDISEISDTPTLFVFVMAGCSDCLREFPSYRLLYALFDSNQFRVAFIWDDEVPQKDLDELNIPSEASYSAKGLYKFTDWVPTYYLVDETDTIIDQTKEMAHVVSLLPETKAKSENLTRLSGDLPVLVGIDRCGACRRASEQMQATYGEYLYLMEGLEDSPQDDPDAAIWADPHKLVSRAFGLDTYPVCLRLDPTGSIIKEEIE